MEKIKFIDVNDQKVVDLSPHHKGQLALVDMGVLHRLTKLLPKADLNQIKKDLNHKIKISNSIEDLVLTCEEFAAFNNSVNLIKEVFVEFGNKVRSEAIIKMYNKENKPEEAEPELNPYE